MQFVTSAVAKNIRETVLRKTKAVTSLAPIGRTKRMSPSTEEVDNGCWDSTPSKSHGSSLKKVTSIDLQNRLMTIFSKVFHYNKALKDTDRSQKIYTIAFTKKGFASGGGGRSSANLPKTVVQFIGDRKALTALANLLVDMREMGETVRP